MTPDQIRAASRRLSAQDYPGTIHAFYPYWDAQYRHYLLMALEALPPEQFHFKPRPELLTAHQILVHIAEAERAWVLNVIEGGNHADWVVEHEDPAQGWKTVIDVPDHAALRSLLETWHRPTQGWFARPAAELARVVRYQPREGGPERTYTVQWILDHLQEHEIHHRAQLNLYLRLLGITPPSI